MKNRFKNSFLIPALFGALVLFYAGCKPSVAGQTDDWKANQEHLAGMTTDMPGFAAALATVKTKSEAAWAEAEKIADEDKKAEAMKAANDLIGHGFAGKLYDLHGLIDEIANYRKKLAGKTMSNPLIARINDAVDPANEAVENAETVMRNGAADEMAAEAAVSPVYEALKNARDKWKSLKDAYDKEQSDRKKKK